MDFIIRVLIDNLKTFSKLFKKKTQPLQLSETVSFIFYKAIATCGFTISGNSSSSSEILMINLIL